VVVVGIPILLLTLVLLVLALVELALSFVAWPVVLSLRATEVIGWRVIVVNTANPWGPRRGPARAGAATALIAASQAGGGRLPTGHGAGTLQA
jgi:hypothetical protein